MSVFSFALCAKVIIPLSPTSKLILIPAYTNNAILILFSNNDAAAYPSVTCSSSSVIITQIGQHYTNYTTDRGNCTRVYYITNNSGSAQSLQCYRNGYGWTFTGMLFTR